MKLKMQIDLFNKERVLNHEKTRLNELVKYLLPPHVNSSHIFDLILIRFWRKWKKKKLNPQN